MLYIIGVYYTLDYVCVKYIIAKQLMQTKPPDYDFVRLIDEFVFAKNPTDSKYFPLKRDYDYLLQYTLGFGARTMIMHKMIKKDSGEVKYIYDAVNRAMVSFFTNDAYKAYCFYKNYANYDFKSLADRLNTELDGIEDSWAKTDWKKRRSTRATIVREMDTYAKLYELSYTGLNTVRIGQEIYRGKSSPDKFKTAEENARVL